MNINKKTILGGNSFAYVVILMIVSLADRAFGQEAKSVADRYLVVQRTPSSRVWQRLTLQTNDAGIVRTNVQGYTELRSGLCRTDKATGALVDSSDEIDVVADGAQAVYGQHITHWFANANTPGGAVKLVTARGKILQSTVFGVSYWDSFTDTNILIGSIQDSQGVLSGNQVTYENAFGGNLVKADIQYTYNIEGLEQCVVFRERLPDPSVYGLSSEHTYVQVITEFFNPPVPEMQSAVLDGVTNDEFLNFGDMSIGVGQAFLATNEGGILTAGSVEKQWTTLENRHFLIEQIPFSQISAMQEALPEHASISKPSKKITRMAALKQKPSLIKPKDFGSVKFATTYSEKPGLVIDYNLVNNATNVTFQGDTTYYVSGAVSIYGTNTFEGGSVIKFTNNGSITEATSPQTPRLNFLTAQYRPVVFTAKDDNSVGQTITGSTGNPYTNLYANPALAYGSSSGSITNIRISYAKQGISINGGSPIFRDAQFVSCSNGVTISGGTLTLENALFAGVTYPFNNLTSGGSVIAKNISAKGGSFLVTFGDTNTSKTVTFTNSIIWGLPGLTGYPASSPSNYSFPLVGDFNGFFVGPGFGSDQVIASTTQFETVGAAGYYLANGSIFLNAGTANIDIALLGDLAQKTVYPPVTIGGWETNDLILFPQAQRDAGSNPSLGYHYTPIDYAGVIAISNATLIVLPGTAFAGAADSGTANYGIVPWTGSTVSFQGTATAPINFVRYNTVQEQSNTNWAGANWSGTFLTSWGGAAPSSATFQFTDWSVLASDFLFYTYNAGAISQLAFQNCEFYNGQFDEGDPAIGVTNCLFRRVAADIQDSSASSPYYFYNNLFTAGSVTTWQLNNGVWTFHDNLFDTTNMDYSSGNLSSTQDACNYNAYLITNTLTGPKNSGDVILTNDPAYQLSFLGLYYYPTNQTNLIYKGSRLASAAGLYHYTVTTNQVIEGANQVSIGFHYVATDANGNPLDNNGDGIPDYIEDANGDGLVSSGEIGWNLTGDLGLTVIITQPTSNSKIP